MAGKKLVTVAIEIGESTIGVAHVFRSDCKDVTSSKRVSQFSLSSRKLANNYPAAVLLDDEQTFCAFGGDAEDRYEELVSKGEHKNYYFFTDFGKMLFNTKVSICVTEEK